MRYIFKFFDKLEDRIRSFLSHYPIIYAIIGGVAIVIFWRAVWQVADEFQISAGWSLLASVIVMMATGLFVSFFIGDRILLSGIKHEKKVTEKTEEEIEQEETILVNISRRLERMEKVVEQIKEGIGKN